MVAKRICVLNPYLPTLGGGEKYMGYMLQFIENYYDDVQIDIIVHNFDEENVHYDDYVSIEDLNRKFGLNLKHTGLLKVDLGTSSSLFTRAVSKHKIERITRGYDLFINHMYLSRHVGFARRNLYLCMFPPKPHITGARNALAAIRSKILDARFINRYDRFISISEYTDYWLSRYWRSAGAKSLIIYPPVFTESEIADRYQESKKENIIISVGRFFIGDHCKRQLDMVRFFVNNQDKLGDYEYHLVGSVSNSTRDLDYFKQVSDLAGTVNNVIIHRDCPYEELIDLYSRAKIFWHATGFQADEDEHPEKMEHFGITTVEAMSYGAVPVVINRGGQKEIVKDGENGFLWETLEQCIENTSKLINDNDLRIRFANISVERAGIFSIEEFYKRTDQLFRQLSQ